MRRYYVLAVKSGQENTAISNLKKQKFTTFNPLIQVTRVSRNKKVSVTQSMFPGYMFVAFDIKREYWKAINNTYGVIRLLGATPDNCPPLPIGFVEGLRKQQVKGVVTIAKAAATIENYLPGDKIMVVDGVFRGMEGVCDSVSGANIKILFALLNSKKAIELPRILIARPTA